VPFLSHGRGSLRQREIINLCRFYSKGQIFYRQHTYFASNRLAMSLSLSSSSSSSNGSSPLVAFSSPLFCSFLRFFCKINRLIYNRSSYASKRAVAHSRIDLVIHNQIAFYLTSLSAPLSLIYKKFRSIKENKPRICTRTHV